ncbi:MAG: aminotransferase class V-fold PLP-dependent enzyme [bacterium]|nr:aminotransferase class V-fold PLP-dependent enzyme [bacterium]
MSATCSGRLRGVILPDMIDVAQARADTLGCESVAHLNNAGSSLPPRQVVDAVVDYLRVEEMMGGYEAAAHAGAELDAVYSSAAHMLNCRPDEIAFTANASDSWWRAFSSIALQRGDRVLLGHSEFQSNAFGLLQAAERGVLLDVVPNTPTGEIDLEALDRRLNDDVKLVCLTQISMANGSIHPAAAVGERARSVGATYLLDACQAAGQLPLDVEELGCDFLAFTGRKFMRGPRGTGILYARESIHDRLHPSPFVDGRSAEWTSPMTYELQPDARRFEFGEQNFAGKIGLAVAIDYALSIGLEPIAARVGELAAELRRRLRYLPGVEVRDEGQHQSGIVTFTLDGHAPLEVQGELGRHGVNVSAPGRRNAQLDLGVRGLDAVVRAGIHYYNTEDEIQRLVAVVATM